MVENKHKRKKRFDSDLALYRDLFETLRFAISQRHGLLSVSDIRDVPDAVGGTVDPMTEVVIQIGLPNPKNSKTGSRPAPVEKYKEFFEAWPSQEAFLRSCGRWFAESIPSNSPAAKYKRKLANIRLGRPSKLPPAFYLGPQYEQVMAQIKMFKLFFSDRKKAHRSPNAKDEFLKFALENRVFWLSLIKSDNLDATEILTRDTRSTAQYVLSLLYNTSQEAVRSKLLRDG